MIKGLVALPARRPPSLLLRPSLSSSLLICKGAMNDTATATATSPSNSNPVPPIFVSLRDEDNSQPIQNSSNVKSFRLVSYNILAQSYVKSSYFPHSPSACLKWRARSQAVLKHLKDFGADFLCLQELDEFNSFYKKNMESFGYSSVYIQRTGGKKDGCGILYKKSSAEMLLSEEIHYNDLVNQVEQSDNSTTNEINNEEIDISKLEIKLELNKKKAAIRGDPNDPKVRLKRDCVGLMAAFKLNNNINNNNLVIIANTHIYWDPEWADVKLAQVKYLLSRVSKFRENISRELSINTNKLPVIITGDFNSIPGDQVYKYITSEEESPIKLYSLYGSNGGEPKFTNYTPGFTGTLDYIFLSENIKNNNELLTAVSLLQIPGPTCEKITGGLPNCFYPSDHLPIGADFDYFLDD
ncbi:hypothetical protein LUZ60_014157 [Juncus effusus]|nr:hypothetical protein LUZ60_014157 [Juncus effusus]